MTEQSNLASRRRACEPQSNFLKYEDLKNGHTKYNYSSFKWENIQREKKEAKRKARWRVFWNCLLAVPGCVVSLYGLFKLVEGMM
jgi:hypothetical protein